jgi:arylformamidase
LPVWKHCRSLALGYLQETPMADMDYEAEYNNRARVPEHEQIFLGWARDAENYRADALKEGRAELGLAYGDTPRQTLDLFMPQAAASVPLALFVHGGYWRSLDPSLFSHVARGLNGHGVTVAVVGYDLCPIVTIADIIVQIRRACIFLWQRLGRRMLVYGWSAGAHLTACMVATDWQSLYGKAPADLVPAGYGISGIYDLDPLLSTSANQDLRLDADSARRVSPLFWPLPQGRMFDTAVGALESSEFRRQSSSVADTWQKAGAETHFVEIAGANHFTIVGVLADAQSGMVARVAAMAQAVKP